MMIEMKSVKMNVMKIMKGEKWQWQWLCGYLCICRGRFVGSLLIDTTFLSILFCYVFLSILFAFFTPSLKVSTVKISFIQCAIFMVYLSSILQWQ